MHIVEVNNLTKVFGQDPKKALLLLDKGWSKKKIYEETNHTVGVNKVNLTIQAGEIFVIMGLSGSGKSTLVLLFNRLIEPTTGSILIDGKNIVSMNHEQLRQVRRSKISMVFQKFALFPHKTIIENVEFGLEIQGGSKQANRQKALESLERFKRIGRQPSRPTERRHAAACGTSARFSE